MTEDEKRKIINETIKNILGDTEIDSNDPERHFCVYMHTNKVNGKMYIGRTGMSLRERWNAGYGYTEQPFGLAIKKYGVKNFTHEILVNNLTQRESELLEKELIKSCNTLIGNGHGYNVSLGGEFNGCTYHNIIYCFDVEGNYIKTYFGSSDVFKEINMSDSALWQALHGIRGGSHYSHGYLWYLQEDVNNVDTFKDTFDKTKYNKYRALYQFSKDGQLVGMYSNVTEAYKALNRENKNQILDCANNKCRTALGYYWRFVSDIDNVDEFIKTFDFKLQFKSLKEINLDHILVYSANHILLNEYDSVKEASNDLNILQTSILGAIKRNALYKNMYYFEKKEVCKNKYRGGTLEVVQLDQDGNFISWFESETSAAKETGSKITSISNSIHYKRPIKGSRWMLYSDYIKDGGAYYDDN